jgi:hypothetical protein
MRQYTYLLLYRTKLHLRILHGCFQICDLVCFNNISRIYYWSVKLMFCCLLGWFRNKHRTKKVIKNNNYSEVT